MTRLTPIDTLRKSDVFPLVATATGIALLILLAALSGAIQGHFRGEEFAVIHHANSFDHFTAWQNYVYEVGRPVAVAYWIYSYEIIGYVPLVSHSLSFLLVLLGAVTAAMVFSRAMPRIGARKFIAPVLVIPFFFNWVSMDRAFTLSGDQSHLSMLLFFLSGLSLQQWAMQKKWTSQKGNGRQKILPILWLFGSFILFALSLLAYEAPSFVFPALVLLAWPLVKSRTNEDRGRAKRNFIALGITGLLFVLIPYFVYSVFTPYRSYLLDDFSLNFFLSAINGFFKLLLDFGNWLESPWPYLGVAVLGSVLAIGGALAVFAWREPKALDLGPRDREKIVCVYLGCILLILGGILPFALVGYSGSPRVYHTVALGLPPIMLMSLGLTRSAWKNSANLVWQKWTSAASVALISMTLLLGFVVFKDQSDFLTQSEFSENSYFLDMKEIVPAVKPGTIFIFIDQVFSNSGCGPAFNMLYDQLDLRCASFSPVITEFRAIRFTEEIIANRGGRLGTENWIIILTDENGKPQIVPELRYGDYDLIITWYSFEPIKTDYRRIISDPGPPSDFYLYLLERQEFLSHQQ